MDENNGSIGTSLVTFLLGVAVGATVAILYAPASGEETRKQISDKASELKDKAGEIKEQVAQRATEWKDRAAHMINRAEERGAELADSAADSARRVADTVRSEAAGESAGA
jgi:gas vesicle protein